ncbi:MAG: hypothetical protein ACTSRZ_21140, partial [Promethearchaeota archaeon]
MSLYHLFSIVKENHYWNFEKIIEIEKKYKIKSTFFFLNESKKLNILWPKTWKISLGNYSINNPKIIKIIYWLDKNGWEIGVHGSYNSHNSKKLLLKEKNCLEKIINHEVIGIRQHYLNLGKNTWELQSKAGFKYDSSFGFKREIGFKNNKYTPFFPLKENPKFMVIPLALMDSCLMNKKNIKKEYINIIDIT